MGENSSSTCRKETKIELKKGRRKAKKLAVTGALCFALITQDPQNTQLCRRLKTLKSSLREGLRQNRLISDEQVEI